MHLSRYSSFFFFFPLFWGVRYSKNEVLVSSFFVLNLISKNEVWSVKRYI